MSHVVAVEHKYPASPLVQLLPYRMGDHGFARAGKSDKPQAYDFVAVLSLPSFTGHSCTAPDDIVFGVVSQMVLPMSWKRTG